MRKNLCDGTLDKDARILIENEDCIAYQIKKHRNPMKNPLTWKNAEDIICQCEFP